MNKYNIEDYKKRKVVPTRLTYQDHYPSCTRYKTSEFIKFLKEYKFKQSK